MAENVAATGSAVIGTFRSARSDADPVTKEIRESGGRIDFLSLDVADMESFEYFVSSVRELLADKYTGRHLDAVVNNAGIGVFAPYAETTEKQFDDLVAVNLKGPYSLTQALLPLLNDGAHVLNISTALTRGVIPGGSAYAGTKGAIEVLTRYQAVELAGRGIRVNTLLGGAVETDLADGIMRTQEVQHSASRDIALGRIAQPQETVAAVPAVLSDAFRWTTGSILDVSGGQRI